MENPTMRMRASYSVTTKGVYTPDVTVEIDGVELKTKDLDKAKTLVTGMLDQLTMRFVHRQKAKVTRNV